MRRLELLIAQARRETLNKEYSQTVGIPQEDFVSWVNEAQDRLYSEAIKQHPMFFTSEAIIPAVSAQEAYELPATTYLSHIENLEYSSSGNVTDYYRLEQSKLPERFNGEASSPKFYIRRGTQILLQPAPQSGGTIRLTFVKKLPRLDIRRGVLSTTTLTSTNVTALTITAASLLALDPGSHLADYNYLSIVDRDGNLTMAGLEYDSLNTTTGVVTITGGTFAFASGETAAVGNYVVTGERACNQSELPDLAERYLIEWMTYRAAFRDGSGRSREQKLLCDEILADTIQSFADIDHDVSHVTLLNTDYLDTQHLDRS